VDIPCYSRKLVVEDCEILPNVHDGKLSHDCNWLTGCNYLVVINCPIVDNIDVYSASCAIDLPGAGLEMRRSIAVARAGQ
jgi:hypothetical protein